MNSCLSIRLNTNAEQTQRLIDLQKAFAQVCNTIAPIARDNRCWNRVALHHLTYRSLREQFPQVGSQMVCNAIYSVSRTFRLLLQHPGSPFVLGKRPGKPIPEIRFADTAPVYFDRHTLSIKGGQLSMFTLDGRIKFQIQLSPADEQRFHTGKVYEIALCRQAQGFELKFFLTSDLSLSDDMAQIQPHIVVQPVESLP